MDIKELFTRFTTLFIGFTLVFSQQLFAQEKPIPSDPYVYVIQKGDDLGSLMFSMGLIPLWGDLGFVQKIINLNQVVIQKNGDLIFPSDKLTLPTKPIFLCNVYINNKNVRIIKKVKSDKAYKDLLSKFSATCDKHHQKESLAHNNLDDSGSENASREIASEDDNQAPLEFKRFGKIKVVPRVGFSKITGTDAGSKASGEVFSDVNTGIRLSWEQVWSKSFETEFFVDLENQKFETNPGRTLENDNNFLVNVGIGSKYFFTNSFYTNSEFAYGAETYLNAPTTTTLRIDKANTAKGKIGLGYTLAELSPFAFSAEMGARAILGADIENYSSKTGYGYYGLINLDQKYKSKILRGSIEYESIDKDTSLFNQNHQNIRFNFGIIWEFGK